MIEFAEADRKFTSLNYFCGKYRPIMIEGMKEIPICQQILDKLQSTNIFVVGNDSIVLLKDVFTDIEMHPNEDILCFDGNFNLIDFCPREMNNMRVKLDDIRRAANSIYPLSQIYQRMRFICGSSKNRLDAFRPNHNLLWLKEAK